MSKKITFESKLNVVNKEIEKRRYRWRLKAISWLDYDDISQLLRIHIYKKWGLWDQKRQLEPWLNTVISNQIRNFVRNMYTNISRPCLNCPFNNGDTACSLFGEQGSACPVYKKWEKTKKAAHDTKMPVSLEYHLKELQDNGENHFDLEKAANILHAKMKLVLKPLEWRVYKALYVDYYSEERVAKMMGYRTTEKNRVAGYKRIRQLKKNIITRAVGILQRDGCETI